MVAIEAIQLNEGCVFILGWQLDQATVVKS